MKCALYFGTFNPLHKGHLAIIEYLVYHTDARQVRLVISPMSPFKQDQYDLLCGQSEEEYRLTEQQRRLDALRETVRRNSLPAEVSDIEYSLPQPNYTITTLRLFRDEEPRNEHILVMGSDNFESIERWYLWEELLDEFEVWIYPRPGHEVGRLVKKLLSIHKKWRITLFDAELHDISSTEIRRREASGEDASFLKV